MPLRARFAAVLSALALSCAGAALLPGVAGHDAAAVAASCQTQYHSVHVQLSASRYPETTDHIADAIAAGQPSLPHIDRADEDAHREASLADYPPREGFDRDESDNRGAGASMGNQLEGWCEGQPFRIDIVP